MTNSKMIKILSSYEDRPMLEIIDIDKYDFEEDEFTCPVRETIMLSYIISEFEKQSGIFYDEFKFGRSFKDLVKCIETGKMLGKWNRHYKDSKQEFDEKWPLYHPDETFEEYKKKLDDKAHARFADWTWMYSNYLHKIDSIYADLKSIKPIHKFHK